MSLRCVLTFCSGTMLGLLTATASFVTLAPAPAAVEVELPCDALQCAEICAKATPSLTLFAGPAEELEPAAATSEAQCNPEAGFCLRPAKTGSPLKPDEPIE